MNCEARCRLNAVFTFLILFIFPVLNSHAQQMDNYDLRALPAPSCGVEIDGDLKEWDLSGEILSCYDLANLKDSHSVLTAAMYDDKGLYLSFRFKDSTPMVNHFDPLSQPGNGWRSDCVQLRFWADAEKPYGPPNGSRITHIDAYYHTDSKKPASSVVFNNMADRKNGDEGKLEQAIGRGVDLAFKIAPDGKGYTQEMRIDWKLLRRNGQPFRAGDGLRMGMEFFWDELGGMPTHRYADLINKDLPQRDFFWTANNAWGVIKFLDQVKLEPSPSAVALNGMIKMLERQYATEGVVPLTYDLPADRLVTLVIEKPDGSRVRNLISDYPRKAGKNTELWDGKDDNGKIVPAGNYRFRGLFHEELNLLYQFTYGSPANPPWETPDGRGDWLADHKPSMFVATDGSWMYVSSSMSEGGSTVIGIDENGQKRWGIGRILGGALAYDGHYLYMVQGGGHTDFRYDGMIKVIRINPRSGRPVPYPEGRADFTVIKCPTDRTVIKEFEGAVFERKGHCADWMDRESLGIAVAAGKIYVSLFKENKIIVFDAAKGVKIEEIAADKPAGMVADKTGNIFVIIGVCVMKIEEGKLVPFISEGLEAPMGITYDSAGNIYVSDWGKAMCVKVFSQNGEMLRKIGLVGGRPLLGRYDPRGMLKPLGMAVDSKGCLWVAEYDLNPKRVSVWEPSGDFIKEFCGATWYGATECNVDTLDPTRAFFMGSIVDLDWEKGLWRIASSMWRPTHANSLFGPFGEGMVLESMELKGRKFVVASSTGPYICIAELKDDVARPLVAMGGIGRRCNGGVFSELVSKKLWDNPDHLKWAKEKYPALFGAGVSKTPLSHPLFEQMRAESERLGWPVRTQFIWIDANGDGLVQDAELRVFRPDEANGVTMGSAWRFAYDSELTLYPASMVGKNCKVWKMPVKEWNSSGIPVYDFDNAKMIYDVEPKGKLVSSWCDSDGDVLLNQDPLTMVGSEGGIMWTYPNQWAGVHGSHTAPKDRRGLLIGTLKVIGSVKLSGDMGEIFCMSGNMGKAFLMTSDGLFIGSILRDCRSAPDAMPASPRRGMSINNSSASGEWFGGDFFRNKLDGKVYLGSMSKTFSALSEVAGLESISRIPVKDFIFTPAQYIDAGQSLPERKASVEETRSISISPAVSGKMSNPPMIGQFDWSKDRTATWSYDEKRRAEATWTFDDSFLYLAFRNVSDDTPMINNGPLPLQLFKTGDSAVFELRTASGNRKPDVQEGDLRLLFTVFEGKPICLLYRYIVPGTLNPEIFSSPVTSTRIDDVRILESVKTAVNRTEHAYSLTAAIPLTSIGFKPKADMVFRGDFGIIHSDQAGSTNELRMHWNNKATGLVSDLAVEAQITPDKWGDFNVREK